MKIGIPTFACDGGRSGIGQYLIYLLHELSTIEEDVDIEIIGHADELDVFLPEGHNFQILTVGSMYRNPILNIAWQNVVLPFLCLTHRYDALFLPAANRRLPTWVPCRSIGTVHDFSSLHVEGKYDPLRDFYIKSVLPFLIRRLTRVISVSECTRKDIVAYANYPDDRIRVIQHGVDHEIYQPDDKKAALDRISAKLNLHAPYVLYISRIEHPGKNHVALIRAFSKLKQEDHLPHQLVLAGSDWNRADEVHRVAEETGLGTAIHFTGFVDDGDLPDLYRGAELFVFPSLFEGFGMPILEAMASGVPVACSNTSSLPEVAGDAARYFDPSDEDAILDAMRELLNDPDKADDFKNRGITHAAAFNWNRVALAHVDVFKGEGNQK